MFLNQTRSGADDWDFGYSLVYKNMATLDGPAGQGVRVSYEAVL